MPFLPTDVYPSLKVAQVSTLAQCLYSWKGCAFNSLSTLESSFSLAVSKSVPIHFTRDLNTIISLHMTNTQSDAVDLTL